MASLEKRGNRFRIIFRHAGRRHAHTLTTSDPKTAEILRGGAEKTLMLLEQQVLRIPEGVSVADFVVSDGKAGPPRSVPVVLTLQQLRDRFKDHAVGKMEDNSLNTVLLHLRHFERTLGVRFRLPELTMAGLQEHIDRRAKKKYRGRPLSPATLRKEIASFRAVWNWAVSMGLVTGVFPHRGVRYPKVHRWSRFPRSAYRNGLRSWPSLKRSAKSQSKLGEQESAKTNSQEMNKELRRQSPTLECKLPEPQTTGDSYVEKNALDL